MRHARQQHFWFTSGPVGASGGTDALWIEPDLALVPSAGPNMVGQLLGGRYLLERELGGGGMGVVYLASDQEIAGETFAVKVLKPEIQAYPDALPLLREEVRTTRALRHPNIVGVYSLNSDKHNIYMLMEYALPEPDTRSCCCCTASRRRWA